MDSSLIIPFVVAILIFPVRTAERPLFESIMPVALAAVTVLFAMLHFGRVANGSLREGVLLGIIWFAISVALDRVMFSEGPMKMDLVDYAKDIGVTYLMIPIITAGFGYLIEKSGQAKPAKA
jgi:hypothetical protein